MRSRSVRPRGSLAVALGGSCGRGMECRVLAGGLVAFLLVLPVNSHSAEDPVVALPGDVRNALAPLGEGVVGAPLPALPIRDPSRLRHIESGVWKYRLVDGSRSGESETVRVVREGDSANGEDVKLVFDSGEVQHLEVRYDHEVAKRSQLDAGSSRRVVYRPGLVLEPRMAVGETKRVRTALSTYRGADSDQVEYRGEVDYATTYVGAYRVTAPAGTFDTRLLIHEYDMNIGPAKAHYRSLGFYADDVGMVAEVSREKVTALLLYRRSDAAARILVERPQP